MTIKEIENRSGMTRANIRFYEAEGLLDPSRDPNGYRNYTEEDLETLKRIRLLRTLHLSLEDIRAAARGEKDFTEVLAQHQENLKQEEEGLSQCCQVCGQMCRDHVIYETFDAQHYLDLLAPALPADPPELKTDAIPRVTAPWRRLFARDLDLVIYSLILIAVQALILRMDIDPGPLSPAESLKEDLLSSVFTMGILLLTEPVWITLTGTTPGKFLFGLRVTGIQGNKLTYRQALSRTWKLLWKGFGFYLPIYAVVRLWKSYRSCKNEETLYWEEDSTLVLDQKRTAAGVIACLILMPIDFAFSNIAHLVAALPPNRGGVSVEEFCENYNATQDSCQIDRLLNLPPSVSSQPASPEETADETAKLDENGKWINSPVLSDRSEFLGYAPLPEFTFTEENGIMTGMSFTYSVEDENKKIYSYGDLMSIAAIAYICAQEDYKITFLPDAPEKLYTRITESADEFEDFSFTAAGVTVDCDFEYEGYSLVQSLEPSTRVTTVVLEPVYGEETSFTVEFSMKAGGR